jgi:hypothetical protein
MYTYDTSVGQRTISIYVYIYIQKIYLFGSLLVIDTHPYVYNPTNGLFDPMVLDVCLF